MRITKLQAPAHVSLILDVEHLKKFHVFLFHESSAFHTGKFVHKISSIKLHPFLDWKFMNGILENL
jgi:TFIIF-interacting CTD phosphatase-like protein